MRKRLSDRRFLLIAKLAVECDFDRYAGMALVANQDGDAVVL
jgi:hypothetical protein